MNFKHLFFILFSCVTASGVHHVGHAKDMGYPPSTALTMWTIHKLVSFDNRTFPITFFNVKRKHYHNIVNSHPYQMYNVPKAYSDLNHADIL